MEKGKRIKKRLSGRKRDLLVLLGLSALLAFAVWRIFYDGTEKTSLQTFSGTESERALCALLSEIDGVGEVSVMICQSEEGVESVVVVCEGARDIRVHTSVKEAVAAALGTEEKNVKIYLKKD